MQELSAPTALCKRDGKWVELPVKELVVGDLIQLKGGDVIPADARVPYPLTHRDRVCGEGQGSTGVSFIPVLGVDSGQGSGSSQSRWVPCRGTGAERAIDRCTAVSCFRLTLSQAPLPLPMCDPAGAPPQAVSH